MAATLTYDIAAPAVIALQIAVADPADGETPAASLDGAARHGTRVFSGSVVLLCAGHSFIDSHIFWPRGVLTMLAVAAGFGLWTRAATPDTRIDQPATSSASPDRQPA